MNGINRRGQKVVCITFFDIFDVKENRYRGPVPHPDKVYTVADFANNEGVVREESAFPAIHLVEIESPVLPVSKRVIGWPIDGFRPVVEDGTKNAEATALLKMITDAPPLEKPTLAPVPFGQYRNLVVDPPWHFNCRCLP